MSFLPTDKKTLWTLAIICCFALIYVYLQRKQYKEHFPSTVRYDDSIRIQPKRLIPKIGKQMKVDTKNVNALPDDYQYLYDYEKNFQVAKIHGNYDSRLDAYTNYLYKYKNSFHNLDEQDLDNLTKLLNGISLSNTDIPDNFVYKKDFRAGN